MSTLLVRDAALLATFDDAGREIAGGSLLARDGVIEAVGATRDLPAHADRVIEARNLVVLPGLVNTHHHFYQTLTRNIPAAQDAKLFDWLVTLYPLWARMDAEAVRSATAIAIAELLLSGCTTASDHTYLWPNGARLDDQIEVARAMGVRFHAARGSMSIGRSQGGLPPDAVVEDEDAILADGARLIDAYHDPSRHAMTRVVLAPCSPFSVSPRLMRETVACARRRGVHVHTHLAETRDEQDYCLQRFGRRPVELAEELGWTGDDVWHAHMVHPSPEEIVRLGRTRTGVAHCATSNMRLGSGIAPLRALVNAGARVGLGVDGSASNDGSHLLAEARQALLLARVHDAPGAFSAREILRVATRGGASVLGRDDIGALAPGMCADIIGVRLDTLAMAGAAVHDPLAALVFTQPAGVDVSIVNGRVLVDGGRLAGIDLETLIAQHARIARALTAQSR
ncbi:8-oxoguanine deaminase [Vulcanimicrobium alpinum]|uniref:8-oxoguanine deaminase n=1 Tax=Vulcanimicrobium alpinum TaxID=3016050 RepID=UPI00386938C0